MEKQGELELLRTKEITTKNKNKKKISKHLKVSTSSSGRQAMKQLPEAFVVLAWNARNSE